ncbi:9057_t:CDS:1, partial [Ambispora leptoticha]
RTVIAAKYMLDKLLEESVKQVILSNSSNIEYIAKTLTIEDESKIMSIEVLAYGYVVEALSKAEAKGYLENKIKKWAERAR